ncbi:MAG: hypothetical protein HWD59_05210 [Coxiellaceae bacterium]|nr:MAG: hypothetical protein HWD59_05210 [Coxiellaceae bacterium]
MSKWKVEALIIENEAARVYHDLQLGFCLSQKKDEIHGFTNEAEMPVIASFQICIKIVNYEAVAHSIKVKIPNAEAADVINTELNKLKLALFCEDDIKKLEKNLLVRNLVQLNWYLGP